MASDCLETEWHLTPTGWVRGTTRYFEAVQGKAVKPPADRVLTILYKIYQRSEWSPEERTEHEVWRSANASPQLIADLRAQFPVTEL